MQTKELSRRIAKPRRKDMRALKRLGRYIIGQGEGRHNFQEQSRRGQLDAWVDTDYAGCKETRKSTSGGVIMLGEHML